MNRVDDYRSLAFPQGEEGQIEQRLPFELIKQVLFFLDDKTLQSAGTVSRRWCQASVGAAAEKKHDLIKILAGFIGENLNKDRYGNSLEQLAVIDRDITLFSSKNLIQVKSSFLTLREKVINILKVLKNADLETLMELSVKRVSIAFIGFALAMVQKRIDKAKACPNELERNMRLAMIAKTLAGEDLRVRDCLMDKAIEAAEAMTEDEGRYERNGVLYEISKIFIEQGQIDRAIKVVKRLPDNTDVKKMGITIICDELIKGGQLDKAIEIATAFPVTRVYFTVIRALMDNGRINKAIEVVNTFPRNGMREWFLMNYSEELKQKSN